MAKALALTLGGTLKLLLEDIPHPEQRKRAR
jgi:hypothetical protein